MKHLFITGMGRSGTTLLDKLLTNHKDLEVLSQPLPLLFVEVKKQFLKNKGIDKYYVLNDDSISRRYPSGDLDCFLEKFSISDSDIKSLFNKMRDYSGQHTKCDFDKIRGFRSQKGFKDILVKCLESCTWNSEIQYLGIKEIMCEEFLPYLCEKDYKCIVIIRDPRDVLASANYPSKTKHFGGKKPSLFVLRSWRKSVEFTYLLKNHQNFHFLRYEDLVTNPYSELNKIAEFIGIDNFPDNFFEGGILDRNGGVWQANSSFGENSSFISQKSKGVFKKILSVDEIKFTEAVCKYEMDWLNYPLEFEIAITTSIQGFKDTGIESNKYLSASYSSQPENVAKELERSKTFGQFYCQS